MLKVDNSKRYLHEAFNLEEVDIDKIDWLIEFSKSCQCVSKCIERVWVDETLDDNMKAFMLFMLGRMYERKRGGGNCAGD